MYAERVKLVGIRFSPWTARTFWVAAHHDLSFDYHEHVLWLGNPLTRRRLGKRSGPLSLPSLVTDDGQLLEDSLDIARWADAHGSGTPLVHDDTPHWVDLAQIICDAGRRECTTAMFHSDAALIDSLPGWAAPFGRLNLPLARHCVRWFANKRGIRLQHDPANIQAMRQALGELRSALGGRDFVGDTLQFGDVALATALQVVQPCETHIVFEGEAARQSWTRPELAREFSDLLQWRDRLFADHAPASGLLLRKRR